MNSLFCKCFIGDEFDICCNDGALTETEEYVEEYYEEEDYYDICLDNCSDLMSNENCQYIVNDENDGNGNEFTCDTCDRIFQNAYYYESHMKEHIVCNIDGCTFTAHEKIVNNHIKSQHSTGLYDKIRHLSTPEDIQRWREERKHRYPTKANIAKKQDAKEEKIMRGERLVEADKKNKLKIRRIRKPTKIPKGKIKKKRHFKKESLIKERSDWNGPMFPFKGTDEIYVVNTIADAPTFEDIEWEQEAHVKVEMNIKNALGALMTAYSAFSDDSDNEKLTDMKINTESSSKIEDTDKHISDNEMPLHQPIARVPLPNFLENENKEISTLAVENESSSITDLGVVREGGDLGVQSQSDICRVDVEEQWG
ncbi:Nuclear fragile X mental retardation-interacting protein 1 (NUFIP1) [Popillia japonica]|uniref:Nuclear fragile X mental retardation-interacting protein 1 (NUFIP1) n=1 Tax=Popillia japonica TaxID=7064 RepID=A0AAW1LXF1_POPJA